MSKSVIVAAAIATALSLHAAEVTPEQAQTAAQNWVKLSPERMESTFRSARAKEVETAFDDSDRAIFHVVNLEGGGFVITAGDTRIAPIIAFSSTGRYSGDKRSPLYALLQRQKGAVAAVCDYGNADSPDGESDDGGPFADAEAEWKSLLSSSADGDSDTPDDNGIGSISDVRVSKLLKTTWDQNSSYDGTKFIAVYNYYSPKASDGCCMPCGCVATAGAQVMYYHWAPTGTIPQFSNSCQVNGVAKTMQSLSGSFDWNNMFLSWKFSQDPPSETQIKAVSKLTYNIGVAVGMKYKPTGSSASDGTYVFVDAVKKKFGYASGTCIKYYIYALNSSYSGYNASDINERIADFNNALYASLDAKMPVLMGIEGNVGGHEIVADGYGYDSGKRYTHLNFGWGAEEAPADAWFHLVDESLLCYGNTEDYYRFIDLGFNIHPTKTGDVISGRVLDSSNAPVPSATVKLYNSSDEVVDTSTTDAKGIYALRVKATGSYTVKATSGTLVSSKSVTVSALSVGGSYGPYPMGEGGKTGNKWGIDLALGGSATTAWTVTYKPGANGTGSQQTATKTKDVDLVLKGAIFTRSGYTQTGWSTSDGGGKAYNLGGAYKQNGPMTFYPFWTKTSAPANDNLANATTISGSSGSTSGSTVAATAEAGEPLPKYKSAATNTVWWTWTAPASGTAVFSTADSGFDTVMGVYVGSTLASLVVVKEDDDGGNDNTSVCEFNATKGTKYYIAVSGYGSAKGTAKLQWTLGGATTYVVRYRKYDGSGETAEENFDCGKTYRLAWMDSQLGWMRSGYEFCGWVPWNPDTKPRLCKYTNGQPVKDLAAVGETIELYCGWKSSSSYRVCFHRCAGPDDLTKMNQVILRNKEDNLAWMDSQIGWSRPEYTFLGWSETEYSTTVKYANGAKVKNLAVNGGTKHLYAVWRSNASFLYKVRFNKYDGTGSTAVEMCQFGKEQRLLWLDSQLGWKRDGYEFCGWVPWNPDTKPRLCKYENGQKVVDLVTSYNGSLQTVNLYAAWKSSSSYRVCFHMNDGTDVKMNQVILRNKEDNLAWMDSMIGWKRDGYVFKGWAEKEGTSTVKYANGAKVKNLAMDGGTKHLYAIWRVAD